jgi:plasmid stabilization system protein ParE
LTVRLTAGAERHLADLESHYQGLERPLAIIRLADALAAAMFRIEHRLGPFSSAPRPYPDLARYGWSWLKQHRYWIAFTVEGDDALVTGVFYDAANIPERL